MMDILTDLGLNHPYQFTKYNLESFEEEVGKGKLKSIADELIADAFAKYQDYKTNKTQYFVGSDIVNNAQHTMTCYVDIKDQPLRHILYHDYLHWCSKMGRDPISLLVTYVSVPQINPQSNQFYRTVYQG